MSLWTPLPISRFKQLERQKGSNKQAYAFPHLGSLCPVAKPFGEGHKERALSFVPSSNPTLWIKPKALCPQLLGNQFLPELPTSPIQVQLLSLINHSLSCPYSVIFFFFFLFPLGGLGFELSGLHICKVSAVPLERHCQSLCDSFAAPEAMP